MMPGPCVSCGATNYPLSYGGPSICPRCDCGPPSWKMVKQLEEQIARLQKQLSLYMPCPNLSVFEHPKINHE